MDGHQRVYPMGEAAELLGVEPASLRDRLSRLRTKGIDASWSRDEAEHWSTGLVASWVVHRWMALDGIELPAPEAGHWLRLTPKPAPEGWTDPVHAGPGQTDEVDLTAEARIDQLTEQVELAHRARLVDELSVAASRLEDETAAHERTRAEVKRLRAALHVLTADTPA